MLQELRTNRYRKMYGDDDDDNEDDDDAHVDRYADDDEDYDDDNIGTALFF